MTKSQQQCAKCYRLALAEISIREITANYRRDVNQRGISAIYDPGLAVGKHPMLNEIENQQGSHAVIREALPHLGKK